MGAAGLGGQRRRRGPADPQVLRHCARPRAHRTELTRTGDRHPVVTHQLRPVPAVPRSPAGPPTLIWRADATLADVLMSVMWTLDRVHRGLLPKTQRLARLDVAGLH